MKTFFCLLLPAVGIRLLALPVVGATPSLDEAFAQLKRYDAGQSQAALYVIEQSVGRASGDAAQRSEMAARLAALLTEPGITSAAKLFLCQQLRLVGGEAQVPLLAKLLDDPDTSDMARLVLENQPGDAAGKALTEGLGRAKGNPLVGIISSLGARREAASIGALTKVGSGADQQVVDAVTLALGRIGTPEAAEAMVRVAVSHRASFPAFYDACLISAQRLAASGQREQAGRIYKNIGASDPPVYVRLALFAIAAAASPEEALPNIQAALGSDLPPLQGWAANEARRLAGKEVSAALTQQASKLSGFPRLLVLGTLAEGGDEAALAELTKLKKSNDPAERAEATRELRRLQYAAGPKVREKLGDTGEAEAEAEALSPAPYAAAVREQRRKELAASLAQSDKLLAYLDGGVETSVEEASGVTVRQLNGQGWLYPGSGQAAAAPLGTVAFDGAEVRFEIAGLSPQKRYAVGFTWWDYDNNGRVQSVAFSGGTPLQTEVVLKETRLPNYTAARQAAASASLPVDPKFMTTGKLRVAFRRRAASNAVVSELWVVETAPGSPAAAGAVITGGTAEAAKPAAVVDLTPPTGGTRVLIVTGNDYPGHKWKETSPVIKGLLEQDARLKVRIVEDPEALASPQIQGWDVLLLHFMNWETPGPGVAARANLQQFVTKGGGLGSVHFACGAWHGEWPEFQNIVGRVWHGSGPGKSQHDAYGKFLVEIADKEHPVTRGLGDFETIDELYTCLTGDAPIHLLAHSKSKVDQKYHPQAFVREYGKGRVFLTTLGHDVRAYTNNPAVGALLRRGCAWAARIEPR